MPIKSGSLPWDEAKLIRPAGLEAYVFPSGNIVVNEWVYEECPGRVQVHSDNGKDYIVEGDPTCAMLYRDIDVFIDLHEDDLMERWMDGVRSEIRIAMSDMGRLVA